MPKKKFPVGSLVSTVTTLMAVLLTGACQRRVPALQQPLQTSMAVSGGPNSSMTYFARTKEGLVAIDLGWWGYRRSIDRALQSLGSTATDVRWVFITHAHRDHAAGWPVFKSATFYMADPEIPLFVGRGAFRAFIPRVADRLKRPRRPQPGELTVRGFSQDTTFVLGGDTVRAYVVPGHTAGSAVYLLRGVLFVGDAVSWSAERGFGPAKRKYSDDPRAARRNLERLWQRLPQGKVRYVCTAHARCTLFTPQFLKDVER